MKITVLNAGGRDSNISYENGIGTPSLHQHPPVNYHAYAACSDGKFLKSIDDVQNGDAVIFLLRTDLKDSVKSLIKLKRKNPDSKVLLLFKETGPYQILSALKKPADLLHLSELGKSADGFLSPTPFVSDWLKNFTDHPVFFVPTPYPFHDSNWDFSSAFEEKNGILLGTKEFDVNWRMHLPTLISVRKWIQSKKIKLTVINKNGKSSLKWLDAVGFHAKDINMIDGVLSYPDYLKLLGRHRLVFNQDIGFVPGQISGDSLLTKTPILGGNNAIQQMIYPEFVSHDLNYSRLLDSAEILYSDEKEFTKTVNDARKRAESVLSFSVVQKQLAHIFQQI